MGRNGYPTRQGAEDPLFAADGKDAVVEAPVATARAISEEEAVEEALRRSLYDQ